jgi:ribosomal RNA assembly protein
MIAFLKIPEERKKILKGEVKTLEKLEKNTNSKISINEELSIECEDALMEMRLKEVFTAFSRGFDLNEALLLLDESYALETLSVKDFAGKSQKRQIVLKGRVIGREGKMRKTIERETETKIRIYGKTISIIGKWENVQIAKSMVEKLLRGAKHSSVYQFLQEQRVK